MNHKGPNREWLTRMADIEDKSESVAAGGVAGDETGGVMSEASPGPYRARLNPFVEKGSPPLWVVEDNVGEVVAPNAGSIEANAHLLAAAWEMRDVLSEVLNWELAPRAEVTGLPYELHRRIRDALAAAEPHERTN